MPKRQTKEQERAKYAWECVERACKKSDKFKKRYGSLARKLAALIQVNGLGQTLAYVYAKSNRYKKEQKRNDMDRANEAIFNELNQWLKQQFGKEDEKQNILPILTQESSVFYKRATVEAMAFILWLRRFAEATLPTEEE